MNKIKNLLILGAAVALLVGYSANAYINPLADPSVDIFNASAVYNNENAEVTISLGVELSAHINQWFNCGPNGIGSLSWASVATQTVPPNTVSIISGDFTGQTIPLTMIVPGREGSQCTDEGARAAFQGSKTFSTAGFAPGIHTVTIKVADNREEFDVHIFSFTVPENTPVPPTPVSRYSLDVEKTGSGNGTVVSDPAGINCGNDCSNDYDSGTAVTLTATAAQGSVFAGWSDCETSSSGSITKTMNGNKNCVAKFDLSGCTTPSVITVTSNRPSTWTITGPQSFSQTTAATNGSYSTLNQGTYTLVPGAIPGYVIDITPRSSQSITSCGGAITFQIIYNPAPTYIACTLAPTSQTVVGQPVVFAAGGDNLTDPYSWQALDADANPQTAGAVSTFSTTYSTPGVKTVRITQPTSNPQSDECTATITDPNTPSQQNSPALRVVPGLATIQVGDTAYFAAKYDPDGNGPQAETDVSMSSTWSSASPSIASHVGTGNGAAGFRGNSAGSTGAIATYQGLSAQGTIVVSQEPPANLSAILTPNPDQGDAPLSTVLTAAVGGTAQGSINYTFWKDCGYVGTNIETARNRCGPWVAKYDGVSATSQATNVIYEIPINFATAMVIVERGGYSANAAAAVIVRQGQVPQTHKECVNQSCSNVGGPGPNRCNVSADCGGSGNPNFHSACDAVQQACVNVSGPGTSSCGSDPACSGFTISHLECQNNSCVIVGGSGTNTCATVGGSCSTGPVACTFAADPTVITRGNSSNLEWSCSGVRSCVIRNTLTNAIVSTGGASGNIDVSPTITTPYSINCDSGAFTGSATVRVFSITEVPPR